MCKNAHKMCKFAHRFLYNKGICYTKKGSKKEVKKVMYNKMYNKEENGKNRTGNSTRM